MLSHTINVDMEFLWIYVMKNILMWAMKGSLLMDYVILEKTEGCEYVFGDREVFEV